jgi:hypothetical protein
LRLLNVLKFKYKAACIKLNENTDNKNFPFCLIDTDKKMTRKCQNNYITGEYENILLEGKYQNGGRNNTKTIRRLPVFCGISRRPFRSILLENGHFSP